MLSIERNSIRTILVIALLLAPAAWAQTRRAARPVAHDTATSTTNVTQQANTYQVELKARMQGGGTYVFDQTYNVAFTDPTVQSAIMQAKSLLTNAGAASFTGPTQLSSTQFSNSVMNTVQTGKVAGQNVITTTYYVGPQTISIDDHGICQSYTPGDGQSVPPILTGCSLSTPFTLLAGQVDFDTLTVTPYTINQTVTTTNTTLTTQVYELDGVPAGNPSPATPVPPSLWLAVTGCLAISAYAFWFRRRAPVQRR